MNTIERTRWGLVALLFLCGLFAAMQFIKVSMLLAELSAFYDRRIEVIATLVSLVSVVGISLGVVAGNVVARLGTRPVILMALLFGAFLSLIQSLLPPFWPMVALRALEGVSHLAMVVAIPPVMARVATQKDQPMVMSIWAMFFGVAFAVSAILFPLIMSWGGVSLVFGFHGAGLLVLAAVLWRLLPPSSPETREITFFKAHLDIYRTPRVRAPGLTFVFYTLLFVALVTFLPDLLGQPALAGILPLVSLAGNVIAGTLGRNFSMVPDRVMIVGYLLLITGVGGVAFGLVWPVYILFVGMGMVPGACFAAIPSWNANDQDRALATGAMAQLGNVGTGLGTPIFAFAVALGGLVGVLSLAAAVSVAGLLTVLALRRGVVAVS